MVKYCDAPYRYDSIPFENSPYGVRHYFCINMLVRDRATGATITHSFNCSACKSEKWMQRSFLEQYSKSIELIFEATEIPCPVGECPHVTTQLAYRGLYTSQFVEAMLKLNFRLHPVPLLKRFRRLFKKQN